MRILTIAMFLAACSSSGGPVDSDSTAPGAPTQFADVTRVVATGDAGALQFEVTLRSPDSGCDQYANWWEVVQPGGDLVYRRILHHSHVEEQPFTRSGGPVAVAADDVVIVRAHMHPGGYGGVAFRGSQAAGFSADPTITGEFANESSTAEPQPTGCAF